MRYLVIPLHDRQHVRVQLYFPRSIRDGDGWVEHLTPASTNGFDNHSFHQNLLSTLRQSGSIGLGSLIGLIFVPSVSISSDIGPPASGDGSALRSASKACCFCDLAFCSCLCCSDRVISAKASSGQLHSMTVGNACRSYKQNTSHPW